MYQRNVGLLVVRYEYDQCMFHTFHYFEYFSLKLLMTLYKMSSWPNLFFLPYCLIVRHIP